ncbi:MAG: hypothetical protein U0800_08560 [Isosphaeraceae bacterium]
MDAMVGTMAAGTNGSGARARKARPFKLPCPKCGSVSDDTEGLVLVLGTLGLECRNCGEAIGRDDLAGMIAEAQRLLRFLDAAADA